MEVNLSEESKRILEEPLKKSGATKNAGAALKYVVFYCLGTLITALIVGAFFAEPTIAMIGAAIVVVPTGIISLPVWYLLRKVLMAVGMPNHRAAVIASLPTGWTGVHFMNPVAVIMIEGNWTAAADWNFFELNEIELLMLVVSSIVGMILAYIIYRKE